MIGLLINYALARGAGKAAWNWLMPKTTIRMDGFTFIAYTDINTFCDRWLEAMNGKTFLEMSPRLYLNPIQIMYAEGRRR
jgi:hypothetical protein